MTIQPRPNGLARKAVIAAATTVFCAALIGGGGWVFSEVAAGRQMAQDNRTEIRVLCSRFDSMRASIDRVRQEQQDGFRDVTERLDRDRK